jgi:MFS family permease
LRVYRRGAAILYVVSIGTFVTTLDGASVQMALPVLHRALAATIAHVQWTMTAYLAVSTAALLPSGQAGDVYGHGRIWRSGLGLFTVASALCAIAPSLWVLVALRAAQGVGAAMIGATSSPILVDAFPRAKARALGFGMVAIGLGLVAGPPLVAALTLVSWRLIFLAVVPFGVVTWVLAGRCLPSAQRREGRPNLVGGALCGAGLAGVLAAITMGRRWGWLSGATLLVAGAGASALAVFALGERRAQRPLLPLDLFRQRTFVAGMLVTLLGFCALFTMTVAVPFLLLTAQQRGILVAGLFVGVVAIGLAIGAPLFGWVADRIGSRWPCVVGLLLLGAGALLIAVSAAAIGDLRLLLALLMVGIGFGGVQAPNAAAVLSSIAPERVGVATAVLVAAQNLGMTLGVAIAGALLDYQFQRAAGSLAERASLGTRLALEAGAVIALLGAIAAFFIQDDRSGRGAAGGRAGRR